MNERDELIGTAEEATRLGLKCIEYVRDQYANHGQDVLNLGNIEQTIDLLDMVYVIFGVGIDMIASADDEHKDTILELGSTLTENYMENEAE